MDQLPNISMRAVIPMFPDAYRPCVDTWNEKFESGVLSYTHFKNYWRIWAPKFYSPETNGNPLHWSYDEEKAKEIFFDTLEKFICGKSSLDILQKLNKFENPSSVCGRVFKMGEPTYSCRECGMDSTCVLCVECFKRSAHRYHKYKMGTSGGGGCCDCGDNEAWKSDPFCDLHINNPETSEKTKQQLPQDLLDRARIVFVAILQYAYRLLTLEHSPSLPSDLRIKETEENPLGLFDSPDVYCTVLYNDEVHTFEHVISTLQKVLKVNQKDSVEYVTNIDREGRAVVKCSTFQVCTELKSEIERITSRHGGKPLKAVVVHAHVVAHQFFAMKLLDWMQNIMSYTESFREIFVDVVTKRTETDNPLIEGILIRDSQLWKAARTQWHRLVITGMLMDYESKKLFAKIFTKHYGSVLKDFIRDDHDHSYSVASLSVQIFTVPTLAHYLIAEQDVLFNLMNTFMSECSRKCNKQGKLEFERNTSIMTFKRAQFILYDIRYLLSSKPTEWTDDLRRGFLQGLSLLFNLLYCMQGMDQVTRQVGNHMEYEPEWESAFNLHIKLSQVVTLALEWCSTDKVVFVKAYRAVIRKLYESVCLDTTQTPEVKELADHSAVCVPYDVSTQPVSIHLPLSRFLAGLHLHLEKFDLTFRSPELQVNPKPSPEQIIEAVMRTQVMIAQVHAGMWRRNGYSLLNQLFFYHNVKCRPEMLDKDLLLLQIGATLIEANEFLIHLLNKFNLLNWAHPDFEQNTLKNPEEDSMRQTISLVEEFLRLLIMIIGERHVPGVGKVDSDDQIKKEIIQQLCIKPMAHSELNKALPEDSDHETGMERVIDQLAEFKKPVRGSGKGVYELKPEFYDQYNVFFYHYTREEQSKSEEAQRKRRKAAGELDCCPPPFLAPLTQTFMMMSNLLQCDVMLHIMKIVLERSVNLRARSFSEVQLHEILHLIGYALLEEESKQCDYMTFTERAEKWGIEQFIEQLCTSARVESHKDLLTWTVTKYQKVAAPRRQDSETSFSPTIEMPVSSEVVAKEEKEWRAKMAAQKREKIMAQMMTMQKNFMKENAKLFEKSITEMQEDISGSSMDLSECVEESPVALGKNQSTRVNLEKTYTCILCQEDQTVSAGATALVFAAFVQQSSVLCHSKDYPKSQEEQFDSLFLPSTLGPAPHTSTCGHVMHSQCWQKYFENVLAKESRRPYRVRQPTSFDVEKQEFLCPLCQCLSNTILPLVPPLGIVHPTPKQNYDITFESWIEALKVALKHKIKINVDPNVVRKRPTPPLPSLVVRTLPAAPSSPEPLQNENDESSESSAEDNDQDQGNDHDNDNDNDSAEAMDEETESTNMTQIFYTCPIQQIVVELGEIGNQFVQLFSDSGEGAKLSNNIAEMILLFSQTTYTKALNDANINLKDNRVPLLAWKSCAYTIHSLERVLRMQNKPLLGDLSCRQQDCLESFVRIVSVFSTVWNQPDMVTSHALCLLHYILESPSDGPSIFDWDSFGFLLPLALSLPSLFLEQQASPIITGNQQDLYVLRLVFLANIVKILLTMDFNEAFVPMDVEDDDIETGPPVMLNVLNTARTAAGLSKIDANALWVWLHVKEESIPFLRCCTLFYHFVTNVPAPSCLTQPGGDTFENLCSYLGLPTTCEEILDSTVVKDLVITWSSHKKVKMYLHGAAKVSIVKPSLPQVSLINLPEDYSEVINTVSMFSCPNTDYDETRNPTMCLICGQMLCSQSYCCQTEVNKVMIGACTNHVNTCGSGVGIFLRVRECEVLLLAAPNRGSFISPPYLDQYGETDQGLRRGNPLQLCPERFKKLILLWMNHGIYEEIARSLETSTNHLATQWQHL